MMTFVFLREVSTCDDGDFGGRTGTFDNESAVNRAGIILVDTSPLVPQMTGQSALIALFSMQLRRYFGWEVKQWRLCGDDGAVGCRAREKNVAAKIKRKNDFSNYSNVTQIHVSFQNVSEKRVPHSRLRKMTSLCINT